MEVAVAAVVGRVRVEFATVAVLAALPGSSDAVHVMPRRRCVVPGRGTLMAI